MGTTGKVWFSAAAFAVQLSVGISGYQNPMLGWCFIILGLVFALLALWDVPALRVPLHNWYARRRRRVDGMIEQVQRQQRRVFRGEEDIYRLVLQDGGARDWSRREIEQLSDVEKCKLKLRETGLWQWYLSDPVEPRMDISLPVWQRSDVQVAGVLILTAVIVIVGWSTIYRPELIPWSGLLVREDVQVLKIPGPGSLGGRRVVVKTGGLGLQRVDLGGRPKEILVERTGQRFVERDLPLRCVIDGTQVRVLRFTESGFDMEQETNSPAELVFIAIE